MTESTINFLLHLLGFCGFLWIGLYMLTRGERESVATLAAATALVTACLFFFGGVLIRLDGDTARDLNRFSWWASVLPPALWLHLCLRLNARLWAAPWRLPLLRASYLLAALLSV